MQYGNKEAYGDCAMYSESTIWILITDNCLESFIQKKVMRDTATKEIGSYINIR